MRKVPPGTQTMSWLEDPQGGPASRPMTTTSVRGARRRSAAGPGATQTKPWVALPNGALRGPPRALHPAFERGDPAEPVQVRSGVPASIHEPAGTVPSAGAGADADADPALRGRHLR